MNETKEQQLHRGRVMRHEVTTDATVEKVWAAWTDPGLLTQWFPDRVEGVVEEGETFRWVWEGFGAATYRVLAADPQRRLLLESDERNVPGPVLEITLSTRGGRTVVSLVASGFGDDAEWDAEYEGANSGWHSVLATLRHYLENYLGRPRRPFVVTQPGSFDDDELVREYYAGPGLSRWLVDSGSFGPEGSEFALILKDGGTITGTVLAVSRREVTVTWNEMDGVLVMIVQPGEDGQVEMGIVGWGWGISPERADHAAALYGAALTRLAALTS